MRRQPRLARPLVLVVLGALLLTPRPAAAAERALSPSAPTREALALLHQGRFDGASAGFRRISITRPGDPEGPLFEALTAWWRLLDLPDDPKLRPVLEKNLEEAIRRGEALLDGPEAQRGRLFAGTAWLLAAQARAFSGSYLGAGKAARKGHKLLERALDADPRAADALFALGAYKYFAARLPWIVKLIRVFVRLPGGSVEEGLEALEKAAARGEYFRTESLLLLAYIYSGDEEDDLRRALDYLGRAKEVHGEESPLLSAIEARFLFLLGRLGEAESTAGRAVEASSRLQGVAPAIPVLARLRAAQALYYQYRPAETVAALRRIENDRRHLSPDAEERLDRLLARMRRDHASLVEGPLPTASNGDGERVRLAPSAPVPEDPRAGPALSLLAEGAAEEAARVLSEILRDRPTDPVARYHLARAWQMQGRHEEALSELRQLCSADLSIPKTLRGWAMLRVGWGLESAGRRGEAGPWFRQAAKLKGFEFYRAGRDRLRYPKAAFTPEG